MIETSDVGRASGVYIRPEFVEERLAFCDSLPEAFTSSMYSDLQQHKRLEVDWLSGKVVALGEKFGIETPCNRAVVDILSIHSQGEIELEQERA